MLDSISLHRSILILKDIAAIKLTYVRKKVRKKVLHITNAEHKIHLFHTRWITKTTILISVEIGNWNFVNILLKYGIKISLT